MDSEANINDLYSDFIKRLEEHKGDPVAMREEACKMIQILESPERVEPIREYIDEAMGEPDISEVFTDGLLIYTRKIWHTSGGDVIRITADEVTEDQRSLQVQLDEALAIENYEKAAQLRDKMNAEKKKIVANIKNV